jgi:hypothetical protein
VSDLNRIAYLANERNKLETLRNRVRIRLNYYSRILDWSTSRRECDSFLFPPVVPVKWRDKKSIKQLRKIIEDLNKQYCDIRRKLRTFTHRNHQEVIQLNHNLNARFQYGGVGADHCIRHVVNRATGEIIMASEELSVFAKRHELDRAVDQMLRKQRAKEPSTDDTTQH